MATNLYDLVKGQIETQGFDVTKINSYSLNRKANRIYQLIIFFGGKKTAKGDKRWPDIKIGKSRETSRAVQDVIEKLIEENEDYDIMNSVVMTEDSEPTPKGDGKW